MNTNNKNNESIRVIAQAFYGNRTGTEIKRKNIDRFILGYIDSSIVVNEPINRTVVAIPDTDNLVIVYNNYKEEKKLIEKEELFKDKGYELKPLAVIPELSIKLYSRCIACRMDENGELQSLQDGDVDKIIKYFAE